MQVWRHAYLGRKKQCLGASSKSPRDQFLELQEKVGENTVVFPNESPVGLDTIHVRAGLELTSYAYAENPDLVSEWLEALNWAEIQRVHETADLALSRWRWSFRIWPAPTS